MRALYVSRLHSVSIEALFPQFAGAENPLRIRRENHTLKIAPRQVRQGMSMAVKSSQNKGRDSRRIWLAGFSSRRRRPEFRFRRCRSWHKRAVRRRALRALPPVSTFAVLVSLSA